MPYLPTAQEWLTQSTLLLKARPATTHITTKYNLPNLSPPAEFAPRTTSTKSKSKPTAVAPASTHRATLTLKTYDPVTGVTLKYSTNKAAEVGRLIQIMGRLARPMSGLADVKMEDVGGAGDAEGSGAGTPAVESVPAVQMGKPIQGGGGVGGKKKKKGKK